MPKPTYGNCPSCGGDIDIPGLDYSHCAQCKKWLKIPKIKDPLQEQKKNNHFTN